MKKGESSEIGLGIVSVVFGILSIVNLGVPGIIMGIVGLIFGFKQKKHNENKWSKWGIILNIIGIVAGVILVYVLVNYISPYLSQFQQGVNGFPLQ